MVLAKNQHEGFSQFFQNPHRGKLKELLVQNIGETDYLDFKKEWPELSKLSKTVLALGNSGGGAIVLGVEELTDGTLNNLGLVSFKDKADVAKGFKKIIPDNLKYEVLDFDYNDFDNDSLKDKKFQTIVIDSESKFVPFLSTNDGKGIRANAVYVRSGTESVEANQFQLEEILNARIESGYSSSRTTSLAEHLEQLRELMETSHRDGMNTMLAWKLLDSMNVHSMSDHYKFIEDMILKKKKIIEEIVMK